MGAFWGLGLARLAAEAGFWPLLYASPLAVVGVVVACAGVALALWLYRKPHHRGTGGAGSKGIPAPALQAGAPLLLALLYAIGIVPHPLAGGVLLVGGAALALLAAWGERARWTVPATLGLTTFALYLRTLLPSVGQADTFEFQVIIPKLGIAHPTGYPLYVLLGKLFTLLPLGNVAWRVNLASAVFAAAAVLVVYALLLRLTSRWLPAFLAALAFAFSAAFWSQAIAAEVYALHNLLAAAILWLLLNSPSRSPTPSPTSSLPPARRWQAIFLLTGLSFANHLTTVLLLPAVALGLLWERPRLRLKDWLTAGGLLLLGLSVYLFIPLRWPALNNGQWMTVREFVTYITGGQFHAALRLDGWRDPTRWTIVGRLMQQSFGWVGLGLAAVGAAKLALRQRRTLALTGVTFLAFAFYGLCYYVPDISVFLLPAHLILALWIGFGIAGVSMQVCKRASGRVGHWSLVIGSSVIGLLIFFHFLSLIWTNLPQVDQSDDQGDVAWGQYVLSLPLAEGSAVLADPEKFAPLYYLQQIGGARSDLDLVLLGSEELYQAELAARLGAGQTVYLARYLPHLEGLHLRSVGPLAEVGNQVFVASGEAEAPSLKENLVSGDVRASFGEAIQLLDAELSGDPLGRALRHLTLHWRAETKVRGDFVVRLRLVDRENHVHWESNGARPVNGLYPTNGWPVGVTVADYHEIPLSPWLPRGEYVLQVGLFPPFSDAGLAVDGATTAWLPLGALTIGTPAHPPPPLPYEQRYLFANDAWLTGHDVAGQALSGAPVVVDLSWRGIREEQDMRLTWVNSGGQEIEASSSLITAGALRSRHTIAAPPTPGNYTLRVGLAGESARCNWLAGPANDCPLGAVEVTPAQEGAGENYPLANFADLVLLLEAQVGRDTAQPGDIIPVTLRWRALRSVGQDYTVFVHLVGPGGRLHGQIDAWPVQGSYPTSQWTAGEQVNDPYQVQLAADAPAGRYRVEVGWYLLATMQRLPTVGANGRPAGDSFVVGEFKVQN